MACNNNNINECLILKQTVSIVLIFYLSVSIHFVLALECWLKCSAKLKPADKKECCERNVCF